MIDFSSAEREEPHVISGIHRQHQGKDGENAVDFKRLAEKKGLLKAGKRPMEASLVWLKKDPRTGPWSCHESAYLRDLQGEEGVKLSYLRR